jgi:hypothetical protein
VEWDLGRGRSDATVRFGAADLEPSLEVGFGMPGLRRDWRAAGYHRLATADPAIRPFGIQNSLNAVLFGRDEGLYFRATGAEVLFGPAGAGAGVPGARLYLERQATAAAETDFSVRRVLDGEHAFRPNISAVRADQVGLEARVGVERGGGPASGRMAGRIDLVLETGTYTFARPGVALSAGVPVVGGMVVAAELAAGTTFGSDPPVQSHWYVGGAPTLRGFPAGVLSGPDHLRGRLELANRLPAVRIVLFSDAAWAGTFDSYRHEDQGVSVGVGASFLDGLLRMDLARGLRPEVTWRAHLYLDGLF